MSSQAILVYGARGHGKVVADILLASGANGFIGFVDDNSDLRGTSVLGFPVFGDSRWLEAECKRRPIGIALGVADNFIRQILAQKCLALGTQLLTVVHPRSYVSSTAKLEAGAQVMAQAAVNPSARIRRGAIVNTGAVVEHDVEIGEFAHVAPNATMAGASRLGNLSFLGIGASVIQCLTIGKNSIVGAGSVVTRDIQDQVVALGVPARVVRKVETRGVEVAAT